VKQELFDDEILESVPKTMNLIQGVHDSRVVPLAVWAVISDRLASSIPGVSLK
jgi:hypothetical protein